MVKGSRNHLEKRSNQLRKLARKAAEQLEPAKKSRAVQPTTSKSEEGEENVGAELYEIVEESSLQNQQFVRRRGFGNVLLNSYFENQNSFVW